ncbi:MAG: FAD-binding oxidoreductase [Alphaproteobacteria bacterium]|nr:MAG: FAD-binding oxidoreductase [Alphaproteobacteria bacterium]
MSLDAIKELLGPGGYIDDPQDMGPYVSEPRGRWPGTTQLIARPNSVEDVSAIVKICQGSQIPIVPQGGNTGLAGGNTPLGDEIVVSLSRLNTIREVDAAGFSMTVDAGCILADIQEQANDANRLFPLSLAAEGSCQIGGNLSTNAGGVHVLRYGSARDLVLGLEVVLPDGRIWNGLRKLRKDNTGYDLKQLFLGAEGTLGIITGAVLKLFPKPRQKVVALVGLRELESVVALLSLAQESHGEVLNAFELIPRLAIDFVTTHLPDCTDPLATQHAWYALIELATADDNTPLTPVLENLLAKAIDLQLVEDGVIAQNEAQAANIWRLREEISDIQKHEGGSIKHDVSVPVQMIPAFITEASQAVEQAIPGIRPVPFGHIGDGNIHFNLTQPKGAATAPYLDQWEAINEIVHDIVARYDGSFSAEHGIGRAKVDELRKYKSPLELELMANLKNSLDPNNIMNPGRILSEDDL